MKGAALSVVPALGPTRQARRTRRRECKDGGPEVDAKAISSEPKIEARRSAMVGQAGRRRRLKESRQTAGWCSGKM